MLHNQVQGNGPELVLLHGWGMNLAVWENIATILAKNFRVRLIDLPGHGYSPWNNNQLSIADWAEECLKVAEPQAIWLGWSLGGTVALAAALQTPEKFRALVLITSTHCFISNKHWPHGMQPEILARFRHSLTTDWAETIGHFLTLQIRGSKNAQPALRSLRQCLATSPPPVPQALDIGLKILKNTDLTAQLANLQVPNLWLYGDRDTLVSWRSSETLKQFLPTAQTAVIHGAAHAPFLSHRDQVVELLQQFAVGLK